MNILSMDKTAIRALKSQESWRYTDLNRLFDVDWELTENHALPIVKLDPEITDFMDNDLLTHIDIINGIAAFDFSKLPDGVHIEHKMDGARADDAHPLNAAENAAIQPGIIITIRENTHIALPLLLNFYGNGNGLPQKGSFVSAPVITLNVKQGASLSLVEYWHDEALKNDVWTLPRFAVNLGAGAKLDWLRHSNLPSNHFITARQSFSLEANSRLDFKSHLRDQGFFRQETDIHLKGEYAEAIFNGAYMASNDAMIEHITNIHHHAPNSNSEQIFHGIADQSGQANFQAKIIVDQGADGTNANQQHKALLLSDNAQINAKPALEIYADAVKCAHGSSMGALDPMQVFYLQTRGIPYDQARKMLIDGFLKAPLTAYEDDKEYLNNALHGLMNEGGV
ncbi:MAG: SufD family Fe-S cluster assembly protein [Alphaproteobacteria bacterium]